MSPLAPFLTFAAYALAIATAALLLRLVPRIANSLEPIGGRYASVDGLRGYLAFGVFIHHSVIAWIYLQTNQIGIPPNNFFAQIGLASVALFFMITGFLFWSRLLKQGRQHDWLAFAVSRVFRLYPLYLPLLTIVVLCVFYLQGWEFKESPLDITKQIALWLSFDRPDINQYPQTGMLISNVTWTLAYEVFFYTALPLLGMLFIYRGGRVQVALCLIGIYTLYQVIGWEHSLKKHYLASFLGGIAATYWIRQPKLLAWGKTRTASVVALIALLIVMTAFRKSFATLPLLLLTLFFVIVASGNDLFGALKWRSIRWLGEISYSTYLLHGFVLWLVIYQLLPQLPYARDNSIPFLALIALSSCLLIVLSSITFLFIEKPGIVAGKKVVQWLRRNRDTECVTAQETAP
ncbi:acyltransferase [Pseudomonas sp. LS1212]|uniref:acyltransferase family protein n=1 Tax=Pseudomonas sp. LS1212 TaxID=2972478 RepID=UPI00215C2918|nr:acyltransferase [Pseudomonas sp. LS1212]UVJ44445.1 acyltransferase [Pseudomonas sp. LS1212]